MSQNNNIIDISIDSIRRKRYRLNGDDNKIIELNPTDFNITVRMNEAYPKLSECENQVKSLSEALKSGDDKEDIERFAKRLSELDAEMKELVDYIFDSALSEACCDGGTMYDLFNGFMRYEIIVDNILKLYTKNLEAESKKIQRRVKQHTAKYVKK